MAIYVVSHREINSKFPEGYKTIIVNANVNRIKGDYYDNIGDNISSKNSSYCELTALYWLWKNSSDKVIGIDHYRRFFIDGNELLSIDKVNEIVKDGTIIVPKKENFNQNIGIKYWTTSGYRKDLTVIRSAIEEYSPEYVEVYDDFLNQKEMYCYNMFVMKKEMYADYCEWLFNILDRVERKLDEAHIGANDRKGYYKRIYGFIGERLFNVYLIYNKLNVVEMAVRFTGNTPSYGERITARLRKLKDKYVK